MMDEQHEEYDPEFETEGREDQTGTTYRRLEEEIRDMDEILEMNATEQQERDDNELLADEAEDPLRYTVAEDAMLNAPIQEQMDEEREREWGPSSPTSSGYDSDGHYVPRRFMDTRQR